MKNLNGSKTKLKRALAICLAALVGFNMVAINVFALDQVENNVAVCPSHTQHDGSCGYQEAETVKGECSHKHDDSCGYQEGSKEILCDCSELDENGEIIHGDDCTYEPAREETSCGHKHDDSCGFGETEIPESPCNHSCELCSATDNDADDNNANGGNLTSGGIQKDDEEDLTTSQSGIKPGDEELEEDVAIGEPRDVYAILKDLEASVYQGDKLIDPDKEGTLDPQKDIKIVYAFNVPVIGDDPTPEEGKYVKAGDYAVFKHPAGLKLEKEESQDLVFDEEIVGKVTFSQDETKVEFAELLNQEDIWNVSVNFEATMSCDFSGSGSEDGDYTIEILGKTFTVTVPKEKTIITGEKTGKADLSKKVVDWTVKVDASLESGGEGKLYGYTFTDDLTSVGEFQSGSFLIGKTEKKEEAAAVTVGAISYENNVLTYEFAKEDIGTVYLFFQTEIPQEKFMESGNVTINNKAVVSKEGEEDTDLEGSASFQLQWIEKNGKVVAGSEGNDLIYDSSNRQIEWSITVNKMQTSIKNAVVTDVLPKGLSYISSTVQVSSDGSNWKPLEGYDETKHLKKTIEKECEKLEYHLGDIKNMVKITVISKVNDTKPATGVITFKNQATLTGEGLPENGYNSNESSVGVGYSPITKKGTAYDTSAHTVNWDLSVDARGQSFSAAGGVNELRVLDMLVYDETFDKKEDLDFANIEIKDDKGNPITASAEATISEDTLKGFERRWFSQKYAEGSFSSKDSSLKLTVYTFKNKQGKAIADLLVVTGANGYIDSGKKHEFSFKSVVTNPNYYAVNGTNSVANTAVLFAGSTKVNEAYASWKFTSKMLMKDVMTRDAASKIEKEPDNVSIINSGRGGANNSFHYDDNSIVFRIHVNGNDLKDATNDLTLKDGEKFGTFVVKDNLPKGWVFDKIAGEDFLLYKGTKRSDTMEYMNAAHRVTDYAGFLTASKADATKNAGEIYSFTFNKLEGPYIILVKARPTEETIKEYFSQNKTYALRNNASIQNSHYKNSPGDWEDFNVTSKVLDKKVDFAKANTDGFLTWTVQYTPYKQEHENVFLEDTLPEGTDLRSDAQGKLIYQDNIKVVELILKADGNYDNGAAVENLEADKVVTYDSEKRVLKFTPPDSQKSYKLTYITDITGDPGTTITNQLKLAAWDGGNTNVDASYKITDLSSAATFQRSGWVLINKMDGNEKPLPDVAFTLFTEDESKVIRTGKTDKTGKLYLRALAEGNYVLKETKALEGYIPSEKTYRVSVTKLEGSSKVLTSIDGATGEDSNQISVKNYKEGSLGELTISKTVTGNDADTTKGFDFTVTFKGAAGVYPYVGNGVSNGAIKSGDTVTLTHGQSITIQKLPQDTDYEVKEKDYSSERYVTSVMDGKGKIVGNETKTAAFTNTKNKKTGSLIIAKTVAGNDGDQKKNFDFTVTFGGDEDTYAYTGMGVKDGTIKSGDTISLAHGQSINIQQIPEGTEFEVKEKDYAKDGYVTEMTGEKGTVVGEETKTAAFTNTKNKKTGGLVIAKTVAGNDGDQSKKFNFIVNLGEDEGIYVYTGTGVEDGTIKSGDTVALAHGQSISIEGIPTGTEYTVTEEDYSSDGYVTESTGNKGTVNADQTVTAAFANTKNRPGDTGGDSGDRPQRPRPDTPSSGGDSTTTIEDEQIPLGSTPEETVTIEDEQVPLAGAPEEMITIEDEQIPLGGAPQETVTIEDEQIPLAAVPKTGDETPVALWIGLLLACVLSAGGLTYYRKKHYDK